MKIKRQTDEDKDREAFTIELLLGEGDRQHPVLAKRCLYIRRSPESSPSPQAPTYSIYPYKTSQGRFKTFSEMTVSNFSIFQTPLRAKENVLIAVKINMKCRWKQAANISNYCTSPLRQEPL